MGCSMNRSYFVGQRGQRVVAVAVAFSVFWSGVPIAASAADTPLANQPIQTTQAVPANVLLTLSVEFPTAVSYANIDPTFNRSKDYLGYFDVAKCYAYKTGVTFGSWSGDYFEPTGAAGTDRKCGGSKGWSGNFLNWATMTAIDEFRWVLTGGNRLVDLPLAFTDSTDATILQRSVGYQGGSGNFPNRLVSIADATDYTEFSPSNPFCVINLNQGVNFKIGGTGATAATGCSIDKSPSARSYAVNVRVCKPGYEENNCKAYTSADGTRTVLKPTGLMQDNIGKMNFGAFGYLLDDNIKRDGGVLRGRMNDLSKEILETGAFANDPEGLYDVANGITSSGTINYLNRFGYYAGKYKTYDPVSEMYAEAIKYYKKLAPSDTYVSGLTASMRDGFPVFTSWNDPIKYWCQQNYIVGIGDVNTHADKNLSGNPSRSGNEPTPPSNLDYDLAGTTVHDWTGKVGTLEGISGLDTAVDYGGCCNKNGAYIAGLAYYAHAKDIRSDFRNKQSVSTYWVDVLEYGNYKHKNQYWLAAKYGGYSEATKDESDPKNGEFNAGSDLWNADARKAPGGQDIPDNYFPAYDANSLVNGLKAAFGSISSLNSAGAGVGLSASSFSSTTTDAGVYQVTYNSDGWTGDVKGLHIDSVDASAGTLALTERWSAAKKLDAALAGSGWDTARKVVAMTQASTGGLVAKPFRITSIHATDLAQLGATATEQQNLLNYLRGDRSKESDGVDATKTFRKRGTSDPLAPKLLGDIVSSKAVYVGAPSAQYSDAFNPGYSAFIAAKKNRKKVVYVGANDGMLHAFDADTSGSTSGGQELFALVPNAVFKGPDGDPGVSGLRALASKTYEHHYYVDATPEVRDVDMSRAGGGVPTDTATSNWKSLLVFGLGKGGRSYVAMDVTDPADWTSEAAVAGKVLWEFTDPDLGFTYGRPLITKVRKYGWVVVVTGGYNNTLNVADSSKRGKGVLFFLDPRNGALLEKVYTDAGSGGTPSGLAQVTGYTQNYTDYTTEQIYGGDLLGNVWRFDVSQTSKTDAFPAPKKIATLADAAGNAQPVTTAPQAEYGANDLKRYVFVGTGRLLHSDDLTTDPIRARQQTFYALRDGTKSAPYTDGSGGSIPTGVSFPFSRSKLVEVTDLVAGATTDSAKPMGWFYDLPGVETGSTTSGSFSIRERVVINPQANDGVISWAGTRMNTDPCSPIGQTSIYAVKYGSGKTVLTEVISGVSSPVAYVSTSDGLVGLQQVRYGDSVRLLGTDSKGTPKFYGNQIAGFGTPRVVNWRVIGQ